jgi:hypothetical protein
MFRPLDAATTTVTQALAIAHNSSGTPAAGFGSRALWCLESSTTEDRDVATLDTTWATATDATRKARAVYSIFDTAAREVWRAEASGTAPMLGVLGAAASPRITVGAAAVDPATTMALVNELRAALITFGWLA